MKRVLCISPHFPPVNAPDMHRLRQCLPYFSQNGWQAIVLSVDGQFVEQNQDPLLLETLPGDFEHLTSKALPVSWTRKVGLGNLGIRAFPYLYHCAASFLKQNRVDLIFFTTTAFVSIALGPLLKRRFGVPFVVDMQDPWRNDYYLTIPKADRPAKFWFNYRLQAFLEARTMPHCDGLISVSNGYIDELRERYPVLHQKPAETIPFSVLRKDFDVASKVKWQQFSSDKINIVYVGRGGKDLQQSLQIIFSGFAQLLEKGSRRTDVSKIQFHFLGTSYAAAGKGEETIRPVAAKFGIEKYVIERTDRLGYFDALAALEAADILLVPGSDDVNYTASKLYPYILTKKPLVVIAHELSPMVAVLNQLGVGELLTFNELLHDKAESVRFSNILESVIDRLPFEPECDWWEFDKFEAAAMSNRVCRLFDDVMANTSSTLSSQAVN